MALNREMFRNIRPSQPAQAPQITPYQEDPVTAKVKDMAINKGIEVATDTAVPALTSALASGATNTGTMLATGGQLAPLAAGASEAALAAQAASAATGAATAASGTGLAGMAAGAGTASGLGATLGGGLAAAGPLLAAAAPIAIPLLIAAKMFKIF